MITKEIQLPRNITNQLLHLAQSSPEQEICGLVGASNGIASSCYPIKNTDSKPEKQFQMDPKQQINAISSMRDKNEELFAIYHSHPSSPAMPSDTDIKLANYPDVIYLIISLNTKGVLELRGFTINGKSPESVEEIKLELLSE